MYKDDKELIKSSDNAIIWRYIDFTKLLSLLHKDSLYFTRVDKFEDPFEGSLSKASVRLRTNKYKGTKPPNEITTLSEFYRTFVKLTYVNCWHLGGYQSAALWRAYLQDSNGVTIRSTFGRLRDSFNNTEYEVKIGKVTYIDYKKDLIPEGSLYPYFHKRKNFREEKELRAVIQEVTYNKNGEIEWDKSPFGSGLYVKINLETLIDKIYLAPKCEEWQVDILRKVVKKYRLEKEVLKSRIYDSDKVVY